MRIIGGIAAGQILKFPKSEKTRPVTDKVKEAIFSILSDKVKTVNVLDLYAGSGSLGIEALSRGAKKAVFVDEAGACAKLIRQNLVKTKFSGRSKIRKEKVEKFMKTNNDKFDLIFADPPWQKINLEIVNYISKFLKPKGIVILSHPKNFDISKIKNLSVIDKRQYGDAGITFFK